jgi:hypothetical protein
MKKLKIYCLLALAWLIVGSCKKQEENPCSPRIIHIDFWYTIIGRDREILIGEDKVIHPDTLYCFNTQRNLLEYPQKTKSEPYGYFFRAGVIDRCGAENECNNLDKEAGCATYYLYLNKNDIDTLKVHCISNSCSFDVYYNGHFMKNYDKERETKNGTPVIECIKY